MASTNSTPTPTRTELDCETDDRLTGYQDFEVKKGGILLLRFHKGGEGGSQNCLHFSTRGEGGSMNCLRRNSNEISCLKLNLNPKN